MLLILIATIIFVAILGAMIGSFLTAWIWRVYNDRSMLEKHSVCPHCQHTLSPLDLIPVISYLLLGGRCRYCHKKISPQYIAIELTTAFSFVTSFVYMYGLDATRYTLDAWQIATLVFVWVMTALLIALFVYDLRWGYLPDIWTLGGAALTLVMAILAAILQQPLTWQPLASLDSPTHLLTYSPTLVSGLSAALFFLIIVWGSEKILHKPGMGLGDVKLALLMGLFLGYPAIIVAIYLAFILGAVLSLLLLAAKQKTFGQTIPFGPFLVVGTLLSLWLTPIIATWYQQLLL